MPLRPTRGAVLSPSQLDDFRSQVKAKRDAMFLAPQLLEHVVVLSGELREAMKLLEELRNTAAEAIAAHELVAAHHEGCTACEDERLRAAWAKLQELLGDER